MGKPTIFPTGTTIYEPENCWNGFNLFAIEGMGIMLVDMNGNEVRFWKDVTGFPVKMLPNGDIMAYLQKRPGKFSSLEYKDLSQIDWDGNVVWQFDHLEYIEDPGEEPGWQARIKSDHQREGNPCGYYSPALEAKTDSGKTLMVCHRNIKKQAISSYSIVDDGLVEVDWEGNVIWQWWLADHIEELGLSKEARVSMFYNPNMRMTGKEGIGDWAHMNNANYLGPNRWYDAGDARFHPDNIIWDARELNIIAITSHETGEIVWQVGPYYDTPEFEKLGWIIGQHHAHMIPRGLPGEGNILVFDNGGTAGYGRVHPSAPDGGENIIRGYSRVLEFDPTTYEIVWQYTPAEAGYIIPISSDGFFSAFVSSAQRLPNGNTLITEGAHGRIIEVTPNHQTVWEYICPYISDAEVDTGGAFDELYNDADSETISKYGPSLGMYLYRAYRVPYEYCPRAEKPTEVPIEHVNILDFRLPGAAPRKNGKECAVSVAGTKDLASNLENDNYCIKSDEEWEAVEQFLKKD